MIIILLIIVLIVLVAGLIYKLVRALSGNVISTPDQEFLACVQRCCHAHQGKDFRTSPEYQTCIGECLKKLDSASKTLV